MFVVPSLVEGSPFPLRDQPGDAQLPQQIGERNYKNICTEKETNQHHSNNTYRTLEVWVKRCQNQNPVPSGSGVIHTNNPKLGTVMEEHIHVPLSNQIDGKVLLPPVERIQIRSMHGKRLRGPGDKSLSSCTGIHLNHGWFLQSRYP